MESSNEKAKKILKQIEELMLETKKLDAEGVRRQQVAQMKVYGWLIEWIQSQRDKLKQKKRIGRWISLLQRITDFRTQVMIEYLSLQNSGIEYFTENYRVSRQIPKMIEVYDVIRKDLEANLNEEDTKKYTLPQVSPPTSMIDAARYLGELNLCLGQLSAHVLGKLYEYSI